MRRADLVGGIGLLVLAGVYFERSFAISTGFASDRLGPTFYPRVLAVVLAVLAMVLVVRSLTGRSDPSPLSPVRAGRLFAIFGLMLLWVGLLPYLGFPLVTPLLLVGVMWILGHRRRWSLVAVSLGLTLALYLVFVRALNVLLPIGLLGGTG